MLDAPADPQKLYKRIKGELLAELMGTPEWDELGDDLERRIAHIRVLAENKMMRLGYVPRTFIFRATCKVCGPIPLDFEVVSEMESCPWCRIGGKPETFCLK